VNGGDGWDRDRGHARDQGVEHVAKDRLAILVEGVRFGEVTPAAERTSFAANQQRPRSALFGGVETLHELTDHRVVHRVQLVGAIEHQFGEPIDDRQADGGAVVRFRHMARAPLR
jgi:hypothetical protein